MKKLFCSLSLACLVLAFGGCVLPKPCAPAQMAVKNIKFSNAKLHAGKIQLDEVAGMQAQFGSNVEDTMLKKALAASLIAGKVYSADAGGYLLSVVILEECAPDTYAFDCQEAPFSVTERIRYTLRTRERGTLVFERVVSSSGNASKDEEYWGENRLRVAKERAIKENLEKFFRTLNREFGVRKKSGGKKS